MRNWPRKGYRVWLRLYVTPKTRKGYPFFKFRLNSANWQAIEARVLRMGYKVNSVYREAVQRSTGAVVESIRIKLTRLEVSPLR
jgi:hypothetical protein